MSRLAREHLGPAVLEWMSRCESRTFPNLSTPLLWLWEGGAELFLDVGRDSVDPCRWDGMTEDGLPVLIRYRWHRLAVEVGDRFVLRAVLPDGFPGATELVLSNGGLKQVVILTGVPVLLSF
jgi:hypothetical protein